MKAYYDKETANTLGQSGSSLRTAFAISKAAGIGTQNYCFIVQVAGKIFYVNKPVYDFFENERDSLVYYIQPFK